MSSAGPAALIVNARSRRGRLWYEQAKLALEDAGVELQKIVLVRPSMDLAKEVGSALEEGCQSILIGGGDGTVRAAAQVLVGSERTLGVLPLGTGNAFARDLGIRTEVSSAVAAIVQGEPRYVDVGRTGSHIFLNAATVGLSSLIASRLKHMPKAVLGTAAYLVPLFQAVRLIRPFHVRLEVEGSVAEFRAYQVVVGNGRHHAGPFLLSPEAGLTTGLLTIYAVEAESRWALFRYFRSLLVKGYPEGPEVHFWHASAAKLETSRSRTVVVDGEILERTPLEIQVIPRALRVFMPIQARDELESRQTVHRNT